MAEYHPPGANGPWWTRWRRAWDRRRHLAGYRPAWQKVLVERWQDEATNRFMDRAHDRYQELFAARFRYPDRTLQRHLERQILPGLAIYQVLRERGVSQAGALQLVEDMFRVSLQPKRRWLNRLGQLPFFYTIMRWMQRRLVRRSYPPTGWDVIWLADDEERLAYQISRCFYLDTLRTYGAPELASVYCRTDDLLIQGVSPYVDWQRLSSLAEGGEVCEFCLQRVHVEEPEAKQRALGEQETKTAY